MLREYIYLSARKNKSRIGNEMEIAFLFLHCSTGAFEKILLGTAQAHASENWNESHVPVADCTQFFLFLFDDVTILLVV